MFVCVFVCPHSTPHRLTYGTNFFTTISVNTHQDAETIILYCCLLRRFNHNYYASNHHIAEDHFPIFVRRVIQMAKVIARRPKLFMNKSLVIFQKSPSQNARLSRESNQVLLDASLTSYQLS